MIPWQCVCEMPQRSEKLFRRGLEVVVECDLTWTELTALLPQALCLRHRLSLDKVHQSYTYYQTWILHVSQQAPTTAEEESLLMFGFLSWSPSSYEPVSFLYLAQQLLSHSGRSKKHSSSCRFNFDTSENREFRRIFFYLCRNVKASLIWSCCCKKIKHVYGSEIILLKSFIGWFT